MSSGSFKDTRATLNSVFSSSEPLRTLPEEVQSVIDSYLTRHPANEDHDSQRLHEELVTIYQNHVANNPAKCGGFLQLLTLLQVAITGQNRLTEWWTLAIKPVIDGVGHRRDEIAFAEKFLLTILDFDSDEDENGEHANVSSHFMKILFGAYLKRTKIASADELLSLEDTCAARQLESVMIAFGRRKPKEFMLALDGLLVDRDYRVQALGLLSTFLHHQPPHLYLASETPIIEHLLQCLMIDTSTTVITLALTSLIMFLPHVPTAVIKHLPRLFLIYSRLLCWERFSPSSTDLEKKVSTGHDSDTENKSDTNGLDEDEGWEKLDQSFESAESTAPELLFYFTFLYGLYPLNFMSYVRKPRKYLKRINFPHAEDFDLDQSVIQSRTDQFRQSHLLHPNFYSTTIEDELTDNKWLKSDPADVVAECVGLFNAPESPLDVALPHPASTYTEVSGTEPDGLGLLNSIVQDVDFPPSPKDRGFADEPRFRGSPRSAQTMASEWQTGETQHTTNLARKASQRSQVHPRSLFSSPNASVHDLPIRPLSPTHHEGTSSRPQSSAPSVRSGQGIHFPQPPSRDQMPRAPAFRSVTRMEANLAFLQREVVLLRNDLNFERYLKNQHLTHIGRLQHRRIKEATIEASTQNLINTNRMLNSKLSNANKAYESLKTQTNNRNNQSRKIEADLGAKLRALHEAEKKWIADEETLRADLTKANEDIDHLRALVVESESKELLSQRQVALMSLDIEKVALLESRLQEQLVSLNEYRARELEFDQVRADQEVLKSQLAAAKMVLQSRDTGPERVRAIYESRIQELEDQLEYAQNPVSGQKGHLAPSFQRILDNAVAKEKKKAVELQQRCKDLECRNEELLKGLHQPQTERDELDSGSQLTAIERIPDLSESSGSKPNGLKESATSP